MKFETNIIWFARIGRPHIHILTKLHYSLSGMLVHHSLSPIWSILHHSTAPPSHISGLSYSKEFAGNSCHTQYPTSNVGLQQISMFFIPKFFNVEKCKNIKYCLILIFQYILDTSCNTKCQFIPLNRYSNTDCTFNMCFWRTLYLLSRKIKYLSLKILKPSY